MTRLAALAIAAALPFTGASAQELTPDEVKALALEAILENPEIISEAIDILREREEAERAAATEAAIAELKLMLEEDPNAPIMGNADGDVTVVEFFDYNCPYCKRAAEAVKALIAADPNVKVLYREWPILGEGSLFAARAALASREQGKYEEFHWALMEDRTRKDEAAVLRIAESVGLDIDQLRADMESETVAEHIALSTELAQTLGFSGTPSFVIGDQGVFGFVSQEELASYVAEAREGG